MRKHNSPWKKAEVAFRPAFNDLVSLAFCNRSDSKVRNSLFKSNFRYEAELFLPAEPFTDTAHVATFLCIPREFGSTLYPNLFPNDHAFCALQAKHHLVTFAVEAKA
jgi:hypothetical protein